MILLVDLEEDGIIINEEHVREMVERAIVHFREEVGLTHEDDEGQINLIDVRLVDPNVFTISDWQYEVANGDTRLGYTAWLIAKLEI